MPEQFGQVKDICDKRARSVVFNLPKDESGNTGMTCQDVVNGTTFREEFSGVIDQGIQSEVCLSDEMRRKVTISTIFFH